MIAVPNLLLVMIGGAIGCGCRYLVGALALRQLGSGYPFGTLIVNLLGGFLMGLLAGVLARPQLLDLASDNLRLIVGVGMLGGFTTFSAFSLETVDMLIRGQPTMAAAYAVCSVAGSVLMLFAGLAATRALA